MYHSIRGYDRSMSDDEFDDFLRCIRAMDTAYLNFKTGTGKTFSRDMLRGGG